MKPERLPLSDVFSQRLYPKSLVMFTLAAGCITSIALYFSLNFLFPDGNYPFWLFGSLAGLYIAGLVISGASFFRNYHREIIFGILTFSYLQVLFLGYLNKLSFESVMLMLVAQTLYAISFKSFPKYLFFAITSMTVFLVATILTRKDFPNQTFVLMVLGAGTCLAGLYVQMKILRSRQLGALGESLGNLLNQSHLSILVCSRDFQTVLYGNMEGYGLLARFLQEEPTPGHLLSRMGIAQEQVVQELNEGESVMELLQVASGDSENAFQHFEFRCAKVDILGEPGYMLSFRDITQSVEQEGSLRKSSALNELLLKAFPDAMLMVNKDGIITEVRQSIHWAEKLADVFRQGDPFFSWAKANLSANELMALLNRMSLAAEGSEQSMKCFIQYHKDETCYVELRMMQVGPNQDVLVKFRDLTQTYKAELALRESEENYRQVFELAFEGILVLHAGRLTILDANPEACRLLGGPKAALIGKQIGEFDLPEEKYGLEVFLRHGNHTHDDVREIILRGLEGEEVDVEVLVKPFDTSTETHLLVMIRDVRERNTQAQAIHQYANLFQNLDHGVLVLKMEEPGKDDSLRVVSMNAQACKVLGMATEEVEGKMLDDSYPGWRVFRGPELVAASIESGQITVLDDLPYPGPDLSLQYWKIKVVPLPGRYAGVIFESVTEQKKRTEELMTQANLLGHVSDAVISVDLQFRILSWNAAAETIYGWRSAEVIGKSLAELLKGEIFQASETEVARQLLITGKWSGDGHHIHKNGLKVFVTSSASVVYDHRGNPKSIVIVTHDVTQRRMWEEQMVRSERKFRDLFMFSPEAIVVLNQDLKVVDINPAALRMLHTTRARVVGAHIHQFVFPGKQKDFSETLSKLLAGQQPYFDIPFQTQEGKTFPVDVRARAFERHGEPATILHLTDISQRISADGQLHLFQSLVDYSTDIIFIVNYRTGKLVNFNRSTIRELGFNESELINLHLFDLCVTIDQQPLPVRQIREIKTQGSHLVPGRLIKRDRSSLPVEINMAFLQMEQQEYIVCIARDISERIFQEEALRQSEQRYRTLVENMNEGIILTDVEETILFLNDRLCEILGMRREELLGKRTYHLFDQTHRDIILEKNSLRLEGVADKYELSFMRHDHKRVWLEVAGSPFVDSTQRVTGTIAIVNDITARKDAESRLLEKNRELDAFVYRASHDLRGPLSSIMGIVTLSRNRDEDPYWLFDLIDQSASRLVSILQELEQVTRFRNSANHYEVVDIRQLTQDIFDTLKHQSPGDEFVFETDIVLKRSVVMDPKLVNAILLNLIGNGYKYRNHQIKPNYVRVVVRDRGEEIMIRVEDNGVGIPDKLKPKVFEMFYRGHQDSKGSGLGLYIVKNAVEKLGGKMQLDSKEGEGSTFTLFLPNHDFDPAPTVPDLAPQSGVEL